MLDLISKLNIHITNKNTKRIEFIYEVDTDFWDIMEFNDLGEQLYYTDSTGYIREIYFDNSGLMSSIDNFGNFGYQLNE